MERDHYIGLTMVLMGAIMAVLGVSHAPFWVIGLLGCVAIIRGSYLI